MAFDAIHAAVVSSLVKNIVAVFCDLSLWVKCVISAMIKSLGDMNPPDEKRVSSYVDSLLCLLGWVCTFLQIKLLLFTCIYKTVMLVICIGEC